MTRPDADAERRDLTIERIVPGGDGMAHLSDGRVAFVSGAFPGDEIRPIAIEARKGHVRITRFELTRPAAHRTTKPCPVADRCGGCDFMGLTRERQLSLKTEMLRAALERTGGITLPESAVSVTAVGEELGYRSRVRFHVDEKGAVGFYARGSHTMVPVPACVVCAPELNTALVKLRRAPRDVLAAFSEIDVRRSDEDVAVRVVARVPGGAAPSVRELSKCLPRGWSLSDEGGPDEGLAAQSFPLTEGVRLSALPGVFTQVNWTVNVALVEAVLERARESGARRFVDAYAGAGNFSLPLLRAGMTGVSVERDPRAVEGARSTARALGLDDTGFVVDDAARALASLAKRDEQFDLVLLDPPRSGADDTLRSVIRLAPETILVCSCDPVTLARDLGTLTHGGYHVRSVRGFDMFPQTHHLEALAWLTRTGAPAGA